MGYNVGKDGSVVEQMTEDNLIPFQNVPGVVEFPEESLAATTYIRKWDDDSVELMNLSSKSLKSDHPLRVTFANKADTVAQIFWTDFDGQKQSYGQIKPG